MTKLYVEFFETVTGRTSKVFGPFSSVQMNQEDMIVFATETSAETSLATLVRRFGLTSWYCYADGRNYTNFVVHTGDHLDSNS